MWSPVSHRTYRLDRRLKISTYRRFSKAASIAPHRSQDREALINRNIIRDATAQRFTLRAFYHLVKRSIRLYQRKGDIKRARYGHRDPQQRFEESAIGYYARFDFESK